MSKRKRKQKTGQKTFCTEPIQDLKSAATGEKPFKDLLFRPTIFKGRPNSTVDFDHITVPFAIRDDRIFMIMFMDGCGDLSVYTEMCEADPEKPSETYRDAMPLMKECLEMEKLTGTEYYFGHLDKALERYLYAMQLFIDKGIIKKDRALEIVQELGIGTADMMHASRSVSLDIAKAKVREDRMHGMAGERDMADSIMADFIMSVLTRDSGDSPADDGNKNDPIARAENKDNGSPNVADSRPDDKADSQPDDAKNQAGGAAPAGQEGEQP